MEKHLDPKQEQALKLKQRVQDLEQQLADARSALRNLAPELERPEGSLRSTDGPLSRILFEAPFPIMIWRSDDRTVMLNARWTELTGYRLEDIPTLDAWTQKAYGDSASTVKQMIYAVGVSNPGIHRWGEFDVQTSSGSRLTWDFSSAPLGLDEQGRELIMVMVMDATERRQAERAWMESERQQQEITRLLELDRARLSTILDNLPVGVWITDEAGRLVGKNKQADLIWAGNAPLVDSITQYQQYVSWYPDTGKVLEPDDYPAAKVVQTGQPVEPVEMHIRRFDGTVGTVLVSAAPIKDANGTFTGVVAINVDISARKQAEQLIRDSEERFSKMFLRAPFGMMITRWSDGSILEVNDAWLHMLGWTREEVLGKTTAEIPFYARLEDRPLIRARIMNDESLSDIELDLVRKDGALMSVTVATTIAELQGVRCILAVFHDITDRKQAEDALRESEQRYRGLFETMQDGLVFAEMVVDDDQNAIDYRYLDVNPAIERQFGIPREAFVGHTYREVFQKSDPEWIKMLGDVARTGQPASMETQTLAEGRWFEANAYSPRRGQFINILTDITERKMVENALHASEARMRAVFRSLVEGVVFLNTRGQVEVINDAVQSSYGHTLEELSTPELDPRFGIIRPDGSLFPEEEQPAMVALRTGKAVQNVEMGVTTRDGKLSWRLVNAQPVYSDSGQLLGVVASFFDITERKQAEEALKESEEKFSIIFDKAPFAAALSLLPAGVIVNINEEFEKMFGYGKGEAVGKTALELGIDPDEKGRAQIVAQLQSRGSARNVEAQLYTRSGERRIYLLNIDTVTVGQEKYALQTAQDITESRRAEQSLRASESRFHSLADSMPQLVWTALPDGTVDYYNKRHLEYREIKQAQGNAWEWSPVLHPDDAQPTVDAWRHALSTVTVYQAEHRVRMADGSYRWHLSRGIPTFDEYGRVARWYGTATDIHEQKMSQEKLKNYAERLERSNRELEQFAFMASHDLQEPLRKIQVFGDLLIDRAQGLEGHELEYVTRMRNAAGRMRAMVNGLLQLSRVNTQSKPFTEVDLAHVTDEVLSDLIAEIRATGGTVDVFPLPTITGDALQLRQVMQNLIGNALKYHTPDVAPHIEIQAKETLDTVTIIVKDNGIGFEQENAERIFLPFQRLVGLSQYEGSGMGLAICRKIVERHGGEIKAQSAPGEGTTFIVTLPKHPAVPIEESTHDAP